MRWLVALAMLLASGSTARAAGFDPFTLADVEDRLGAAVPLDGRLVDAAGEWTTLRELTGRPVLLAPLDYGCTNICGVTLRGLVQALDMMTLEPGRDFEVVVLGIDPRDGPDEAAAERAAVLGQARAGVHFLTGETAPVADAIGFRYAYDGASDQYAHAAAVAVLTPDGRLARWLYGYPFQASDIRLALVEAADGTVGTLTDRLWLLCYGYDPELGAYTAAVGTALRAGGGLTVLALGSFVLVMLRRDLGSRSPRKNGSGAPEGGSHGSMP
ncbi:MAG: SCO family protein [Geminicoccaceae bacterium]|nr:SCO family protein [Geminicoccaceae bacterium]